MSLTMNVRLGLLVAVAPAIVALLAPACGPADMDPTDDVPGSNGNGNGNDNSNGGDDDDDPDGGGAGFENVFPVNLAFWHQGFRVEITDAVHAATEPDVFGDQDFTLTLEAMFANEGTAQTRLSSSATLIASSGAYNRSFGSDIPNVPGGLELGGGFVFFVDEEFSIDDAYLLVGSGEEQQARVPLGPDGGELVTLEPVDVPLTGTISTSLIDLNFTSGELRADDPVNHEQMDAGQLALTLNFDATSRRSGNWSVFATAFALTLPSGSSPAVDGLDIPSLPGSAMGLDTTGLYVRFVVDDPAAGPYVLRFFPGAWGGDADPEEVLLEFDVE